MDNLGFDTSNLPSPLAELAGRLERTSDEFPEDRERLAALLFEALLFHWTAVLVGVCRSSNAFRGVFGGALRQLLGNPTLGVWLSLLRTALPVARDEAALSTLSPSARQTLESLNAPCPAPMDDFARLLHERGTGMTKMPTENLVQALGILKEYRNLKAHGGAWLGEHLRAMSEPLVLGVASLVRAAPWLKESPLVLVSDAGSEVEGGAFRHLVEFLVGETPRRSQVMASRPLAPGSLVFDPEAAAIELGPVYAALTCTSCRGRRIFVAAREIGEANPQYLHLACGTHKANPDVAAAWATLLTTPTQRPRAVLVAHQVLPAGRAVQTGEEFRLCVTVRNQSDAPLSLVHCGIEFPPTVELVSAPLQGSNLSVGAAFTFEFRLFAHTDGRVLVPPGRVSYQMDGGRLVVRPLPAIEIPVVFNDFPHLIARGDEIEQIRTAWAHIRVGTAHLVTLMGAAGAGKTAIAKTFLREIRDQMPDSVVLWTRCLEEDLHPLSAFADLLRRYLTVYADRPSLESACKEVLHGTVSDLLRQSTFITEVLAVFAMVMGSEGVGLRRATDLGDYATWAEASRKTELFAAVSDAIAGLSEGYPVVLFFENVQFLHRDAWALLRYLARQLSKRSLLVLCEYGNHAAKGESPVPAPCLLSADEVRAQVRKLSNAVIQVAPLSTESLGELFDALLPKHSISTGDRDSILEFSQGLPSWLVETVRVLRAKRQILHRDGHWVVGGTLVVSEAFTDVIRQRYEALDPPLRRIVDNAAVLGKRFTRDLLAEVTSATRREEVMELNSLVRQLREIHHIFREETEAELSFSHARIHEIIYSEIDPGSRRALHRYVATMLESRPGADDQCLEIAFHFGRAGDNAKALDYLERAATKLEETMAYDDARRMLERALSIVEDCPSLRTEEWRFSIRRRLARLFWLDGQTEESVQVDLANIALGLHCGRKAEVCEIYRILSMTREMQGRYDEAWSIARSGYELASLENLDRQRFTLCLQLGVLARQRRQIDDAQRWLEAARDWAERNKNLWLEAESTRQLGILHRKRGNVALARESYQRSIELFGAMPGLTRNLGLGMAYDNLAALLQEMDDMEEASSALERSLECRRAAKDGIGTSRGLFTKARFEFLNGKLTDALRWLDESQTIKQRIEDREGIAKCEELRGEILLMTDQWRAAITCFERARDLYTKVGLRWDTSQVQLRIASALVLAGRLETAVALMEKVEHGRGSREADPPSSELLLLRAELAWRGGDMARYRAASSELHGRGLAADLRSRLDTLQTLYLLSEGQNSEALALVESRAVELAHNPWLAVRYLRLSGDCYGADGHDDRALTRYADALALLAGIQRPAEAAQVEMRIARTLRRQGKLTEARRLVERAWQTLRELDCETLVAEAVELLEELSVQRGGATSNASSLAGGVSMKGLETAGTPKAAGQRNRAANGKRSTGSRGGTRRAR